MTTKLTRIRNLFYLQQFTANCMVIFPYYAIMFSERSHLSTLEISVLFGWWTLVAFISELPTGTLADKFSRRFVIILSNILRASAFLAWLFIPTFIGYAFGFLLWGISFALNSGAFQAYLYDELKAENKNHEFTKIFGRSQSMGLLGMIAAYIVATIIGPNYSLALILSIAVSLVSAYTAYLFPLPAKIDEGTNNPSQFELLKMALSEVSKSKLLIRLVLTISIVNTISVTMEEYVPLYDKMVGVPVPFVPLVLIIGMSLAAAINWYAHHFETKAKLFWLLIISVAGITLFFTSYGDTVTAVAGIIVFMRLINLSLLIFQSKLQHYIDSKSRATVGSLPTFISELLFLGFVAMYGIIAELYGDFASIRFVALGTFIMGILLVFYWRGYQFTNKLAD